MVDFPQHDISTLPLFTREKSRILVISSAKASDKAVSDIRRELLLAKQGKQFAGNHRLKDFQFVGFGVKTRGRKYPSDTRTPVLIQVATFSTAYLFRLQYDKNLNMKRNDTSPMTMSLRCLLSDWSIIKVGDNVRSDVAALNRKYGDNCCGDGTSFLDLGSLAQQRWPKVQSLGLGNLTATVLHHNLCFFRQPPNWYLRKLSQPMEAYAAAEVFVALDLLAIIVALFDGYCINPTT